ncbi:MAG: STAS/SEC14 domain-containing protein [Cytophagales bacterium]|nr:STAS/SEC14 domain-containing protein [Bernardetiaceae bacterium]MDW8211488.1 STAS/SEC14 domain-containing protein [Cytophagales bacterium]
MQIYQSRYAIVEVFPDRQFNKVTWLPTTAYMTEEEFKTELINQSQAAAPYGHTRILVDTSQFLMTITPATQEWAQENIYRPIYEAGTRPKVAYLVSRDLFSQASIEQTMDEGVTKEFQMCYFQTEEEALQWLLE